MALITNILLVDDDSTFLMAMEAVLAGPDRTIFKAQSSEDALRLLLEYDFSLIVLDVRMPKMDGFEIALLIRQRVRSRYIPIIFISGTENMGKDVIQGISHGAIDYLFKPITPQLLESKVSAFVNLFHLHEQLKQRAVQRIEEPIEGFSTEIWAIRPGLLFLPITGFTNEQRFSQLYEWLLKQIRLTKAKVVVIDVTATSIEVSVMRAIKSFVETARGMNVQIIFTGSNTSISNAKFVSEIRVEEIFTNDDLQTCIRKAEHFLTERDSNISLTPGIPDKKI